MMRLSALIVLAALVGPATSFESAELKRRRKAKKEAVSYLNVDGWTGEAAQCAACEATARQMEDKMRTGQHKTGEVERLGLLMEVCDGIETQLPMKLAPVEKGGPDVLHFFRNDNAMAELKREGGGPIDLSKLGLLEFCNAVVEEWEEELAEVMDNAKPTMAKFGASLYGKPISNYELKVDVCVKATGLCAEEELNTITQHRIAQVDDRNGKLERMMREIGGAVRDNGGAPDNINPGEDNINPGGYIPPGRKGYKPRKGDKTLETEFGDVTVTAPQDLKKVFPDGKIPEEYGGAHAGGHNFHFNQGAGDEGKGKGKGKGGKKRAAAEEPPRLMDMLGGAWRELAAAPSYVHAAAVVATVGAIYIGGMVARLW